MYIKRILFTLVLMFVISSGIFAQQAKIKRAQQLMENLDYIGAIELYNQILEKDDNSEAKINLAECYRKIGDSENAEYWYGQVVRLPEALPIHKLYYGQTLQRNGKCNQAKNWYIQYVEDVPEDVRGQFLVKACDYEEELMTKNAGIYEIEHLEFNSSMDDFAPAFYKDGIVFASERDQGAAIKRKHAWTGNPFLELYFIRFQQEGEECGNYTFGSPEKFSDKINSKYHDAVVAFNKDQSEIYFTRNNFIAGKTGKSDDGIIKLKVYSADISGSNWHNLQGLPFNSDEYSVAHPTISPDGTRLFFSSDMPGGFGGMDLYMTEKENGSWGPPINLGPEINTEGNELFPYYHFEKLYFASDGHIGLGGLDIYVMEDKGNNEWGTIENLGFPINTISDDFAIIFNEEGTCGFLSSDRTGGAGRDDIYSFKKVASPVEIFVYDEATGEPIAEALVVNSCTNETLSTSKDGKVVIDQKMNICCTFTVNKELYYENAKEGCTKNIKLGDRVLVEIPMKRQLEFDIEGIVFDQRTGLPLEGAKVILTNDCEEEAVQELFTDATGRYYFKLKENCCYSVRGEKETYLAASIDNQCTRDLDESTTLQANLNLQPTIAGPITDIVDNRIKGSDDLPCDVYKDLESGLYVDRNTGLPANGPCGSKVFSNGQIIQEGFDDGITPVEEGGRLTYLLHIYYDFDQSYLRKEAEPELQKLLKMLEDNPKYIIEIGSHTDSRGSNRYNTRLSQRRAESVVRWLVTHGVNRDRLVARGYGETINVNDCKNNVPCSEREHQMNRRTEFRVLGCMDCVDNPILSHPNENTRVDACQGCPF